MIAIGIRIGKPRGDAQWTPPTPDALFDSRSGLTISDSIGAQSITVGNFPLMDLTIASSSYAARFYVDCKHLEEPAEWTAILLWKRKAGDPEAKLINNYALERTTTVTTTVADTPIDLHTPNPGFTTIPVQNWDIWHIAGHGRSAVDGKAYAIWDINRKNAADTSGSPSVNYWQIGALANSTDIYFRGYFVFNKLLTDGDLNNIRLNGIFPTGCEFLICPFQNIDDVILCDNWDGVQRIKGVAHTSTAHGWYVDVGANLPDNPWALRDSDITGAYFLNYGYTRQGIYPIPYKCDKTKGSHSDTDDIEYPTTSCIHNMAESMIDFSGVTDADIKAIFNKADRTYWKVSIESTDFYSLGAYLWHPDQLVREFITTHAEVGHENHIFASLRTSGTTVTGLTALRIYKTSL